MKRIIAIILSLVAVLALFAACGKKDDTKDENTTARNDMTTAMEQLEDDMTDIGDKLTENGNVTDQTGEGMLDEALTNMSEMLEGDTDDTTVEDETTTTKKN